MPDDAAGVQDEYPRFVSPFRQPGEAPFGGGGNQAGARQVALNFLGVVVEFNVDVVGGIGAGGAQFGHGVNLGAASGAGAESGRGKDDDAGAPGYDGIGNGMAVKRGIGFVGGGQIGQGLPVVGGFGGAGRGRFSDGRHRVSRLHRYRDFGKTGHPITGRPISNRGNHQGVISGLGEIHRGAVRPAHPVGPFVVIGDDRRRRRPAIGIGYGDLRLGGIYQTFGGGEQEGNPLRSRFQHFGCQVVAEDWGVGARSLICAGGIRGRCGDEQAGGGRFGCGRRGWRRRVDGAGDGGDPDGGQQQGSAGDAGQGISQGGAAAAQPGSRHRNHQG